MRRILTFLTVFLCLSAMPLAAFAESSIGVVDVRHVLTNAQAAKHVEKQRQALREKFLSETSKIEQDLRVEEKALLEQSSKLSQEDYLKKRRAYESKLFEIRKQTQKKRRQLEEASNAAMDVLREQLYVVVQSIANERGFELVISNQNVIAGETSLDITEETMKRLNEQLKEIPLKLEEAGDG